MMPSTTHDHIAAWIAANPKTQGATMTSAPTISATHSSHSANCANAATPMRKMTTPPTHAALAAMRSPENPRAQGDMKSSTPQIRLIQSWIFFWRCYSRQTQTQTPQLSSA